MSIHKHIDTICIVITILTLVITVLFMNGERFGIETVVDEDAEVYENTKFFTKNDMNGDWSETSATVITLKGDSASVVGDGAYFYNGDVIISKAGFFVISGELNTGSIIVSANKNSKVFIKLKGVDITCDDDACIRVDKADKVFITLAEGTKNTLESGSEYSQEALDDNTGGVIFSHDDLTINGSGSLTVKANYKHGIDVNDDLIITGGDISISAPKDGLHIKDSIRIMDADITIDAEDDGVTSDNEDGYLYMESGTLTIVCNDDGIHTTGGIWLIGGTVNVSAADDAIHSDSIISVSGADVIIEKCHEGFEAHVIDISDGNVTVTFDDDGFNANGSRSQTVIMQPGSDSDDSESGQTESAAQDTEAYIKISGGKIILINENGRDVDGLDSNGSIYITGGEVYISVPGNGSNNAIDFASENNGICMINGGTVIACGAGSMLEELSPSSTQCSIMYGLSGNTEADAKLELINSAGEKLISYEIPVSCSHVILSTPAMNLNEKYTLTVGNASEEVTLESIVTTLGTTNSMGMGGMSNPGQGNMQTPPDGENFTPPDGTGQTGTDGSTTTDTDGNTTSTSRPTPPNEGNFTPTDGSGQTGTDGTTTGTDGNASTDDRPTSPDGGNFTPTDGNSQTSTDEEITIPETKTLPTVSSDDEKSTDTSASSQEDTAEETVKETAKEVSQDEWIVLGICAFILLAGLGIAFAYKKR